MIGHILTCRFVSRNLSRGNGLRLFKLQLKSLSLHLQYRRLIHLGFLHTQMSERVSCALDAVSSPFPSLLIEDLFSVNASTKLLRSLICLFISKKRRSTEFCPMLTIRSSESPSSNTVIWSLERTSGTLLSLSLSLSILLASVPCALRSSVYHKERLRGSETELYLNCKYGCV